MGFWIFMLVMNSLIPLTMIGFGKYFKKQAPKTINMAFGYRTKMSSLNKDTWQFAHEYCGNLWYKIGVILLPITVCAMLFALGRSKDFIDAFGGIITMVQLVFLVGAIFPTEMALNKTFDKNGNRK